VHLLSCRLSSNAHDHDVFHSLNRLVVHSLSKVNILKQDSIPPHRMNYILPPPLAPAAPATRSHVTEDGRRLVRFLKVPDFFIGQFDIDRVCKSRNPASATKSGADMFDDLPIISCKFSNLVVPTTGAVTFLRLHATATWAILTPFLFAISSTRPTISWAQVLELYNLPHGPVSERLVDAPQGRVRIPPAMGLQGIIPTPRCYTGSR